MAQVQLCNVTKKFKNVKALNDVNLEIKDKEFFVLFGPAGAGKTTILKTIAGLELPNEGLVKMNGEIVNLVEPAKRNVSMVFENYALYPHISVFDNIASPMRSPLYRKDEEYIKKEVLRVASIMKIDHLMERLPSQLSNGQRQRVALGRCLVREPNIFLMDEPLAHLDAKLRSSMRTELKEMQTNLNCTTAYVTHDYMEALSLGDRIAIINDGAVEQIGTGDAIYYLPANEFVARIMGEPEINIFPATAIGDNSGLKLTMLGQETKFKLPHDIAVKLLKHTERDLHVAFRAAEVTFSFTKDNDECISARVYSLEPIGNKSILILEVNGTQIRTTASNNFRAEMNSNIFIKFNFDNAIFFDRQTGKFITRHNEDEIAREV